MDKEKVEHILRTLNYIPTGNTSDEYEEWAFETGEKAYVGSWYIEQENWGHAHPYKDTHYNEQDLIEYLSEGLT